MLIIALAIKLTSKGPIFYISKRIGTGYQEFGFLKFRSMVVNADAQVEQLKNLNQYGADGAFFKVKNDPRVTRIGRLLRNTSLDELPQLLNVLKGDMSIVGNRPLPLREAETLTSEEWSERFLAPAGITGKWQTSGRGKDTMDTESRMTLDIQYAREYSPMMDLKILIKTIGAMKQDANV
jgi:lipopolysaccharide/colanic/teichoic acid biosynthesis glycosyltransferase